MRLASLGADGAGLKIHKHFHLLKNSSNSSVHSSNKGSNLYKHKPVSRFFERFLNEGPRRGDGCFEGDTKETSVRTLEVKLHKSKQIRSKQKFSLRGISVDKLQSTPTQLRTMNELLWQCQLARKRLMSSRIWREVSE
tara:strand:- start:32 stop:445 length:414 start_codon:yes stop_codon:yes gene_type:complete